MNTMTEEVKTEEQVVGYDNYQVVESFNNRRPYVGYRWDDVHMILGERHYGEKYQEDILIERVLKDTGFTRRDVRNKFMDNWGWYVGIRKESVAKKLEVLEKAREENSKK